MAGYTRVNLRSDVKDMAPEHGMEGLESRFARTNLELENSGLSLLPPRRRLPHAVRPHALRAGGGLRDPLRIRARGRGRRGGRSSPRWDAIRIPPETIHGIEAGPDGAEILAFGAPNTENKDADMQPGWWPESD